MIVNPCKNLPNWDWKSGDVHADTTTTVPFNRNYFDCGVYYFDGTFNVVKFPKGMSLYHGSGVLANAVVEFPVGIKYYEPYKMEGGSTQAHPGIDSGKFLSLAATSEENIEELISKHLPITAGWYADPNIGRLYSHQSGKNLRDVCGDKCVFSYKLKKDIVMYLLDDDYNIAKLLSSNTSMVPDTQKKNILKMFNMKMEAPKRTHSDNPFNRLYYPKKRVSSREWDLPFAEWACKAIINKQQYSGYCATSQKTTDDKTKFHLEFIFCNAFDWLKRDLSNVFDWQHNPSKHSGISRTFMEQLGLYECTNVDFHSGDLLEHSIWTLLFAEYLVDHGGLPAQTEIMKKIIVFTAFIHDIGKMAPSHTKINNKRNKFIYFNIPTHPKIGSNYIKGTKPLPVFDQELKQISVLDINKLFDAFGISQQHKIYVATVIELHWDFGDLLKKFNESGQDDKTAQELAMKYLSKVDQILPGLNKTAFMNLLYILLVVSMADIMGAQPYGNGRLVEDPLAKAQLNKQSRFYPFITNMPKKYRGGNVAEISDINITGKELALKIIDLADRTHNG
jgi:hypothetical protein